MPKAFDDESEFTSEPAEELSKLTVWERLQLIYSGRYIALTSAVVAGFVSLIISFLFVATDTSIERAVREPFAQIGQIINEDTAEIAKAHNNIRDQLKALPDSKLKTSIANELEIINQANARLNAVGDSLTTPANDKRSSLSLISSAHAQTTTPSKITPDNVRLYGIIVILLVLGAAFLLCIGIILFSNHTRRLTFAIDTTKVLMGFFVGVATSFFGVR